MVWFAAVLVPGAPGVGFAPPNIFLNIMCFVLGLIGDYGDRFARNTVTDLAQARRPRSWLSARDSVLASLCTYKALC